MVIKKVTFIYFGIIAIICIGIIVVFFSGALAPGNKQLTIDEVGDLALQYINAGLIQNGKSASLVGVSIEKGLVKVKMDYEGNVLTSYATQDAKLFFPSAVDITNKANYPYVVDQNAPLVQKNSTPVDELTKFVSCLKKSNFVIYGVNTCYYTQALLAQFGGKEVVASIYVDCDKDVEVCDNKKITGFPTILVNNKEIQGETTFDNFSEITGCPVPTSN